MTLTNIAETLRYFWLTWVAPPLEFLLILLIVYALLYIFRRTRAISVLWGVIVILLGLGLVSHFLKLEVFQWILQNLWQLLALAMIVISSRNSAGRSPSWAVFFHLIPMPISGSRRKRSKKSSTL